ncbi:unnamed protein product [Timema podura]|uniref:Uncharacterized protein n=1 Tax=Timema podura TaxID=61482 RepID=A0ABN7NWS0_TIMPD|nr:unnamed protein product [Timema podura]
MNSLVFLCSVLWIATISTVAQEKSNIEMFLDYYQKCKEEIEASKEPSMGEPPKPAGPPNPNECPKDEDEKLKNKGMDAEKAKSMCTKLDPDQQKEMETKADQCAKDVGTQETDMDAAMIMCEKAVEYNIMKLMMECQ